MQSIHDAAAAVFAQPALTALCIAPVRTAAVAALLADDRPGQPVFAWAFFTALAPVTKRQAA